MRPFNGVVIHFVEMNNLRIGQKCGVYFNLQKKVTNRYQLKSLASIQETS